MNTIVDLILLPFLIPMITSFISYLIDYSNSDGEMINLIDKSTYSIDVNTFQHIAIFFLSHSLWGITYIYSKNANIILIYVFFLLWSFAAMLHANSKAAPKFYLKLHLTIFTIVIFTYRFSIYYIYNL